MALVKRRGAGRIAVAHRRPFAPVDEQRERVLRARVRNRAGHVGDPVLVHGRSRHAAQQRGHVVDRHRRAGRVAAGVVVAQAQANGVDVRSRPARIVVQVLMHQRERLAARGARSKRVRLGVVRAKRIAPVNIQRERVQRARIADRAGQGGRAILVDHGHWVEHQRRSDVVNCYIEIRNRL